MTPISFDPWTSPTMNIFCDPYRSTRGRRSQRVLAPVPAHRSAIALSLTNCAIASGVAGAGVVVSHFVGARSPEHDVGATDEPPSRAFASPASIAAAPPPG